jgi:hypothetical protein
VSFALWPFGRVTETPKPGSKLLPMTVMGWLPTDAMGLAGDVVLITGFSSSGRIDAHVQRVPHTWIYRGIGNPVLTFLLVGDRKYIIAGAGDGLRGGVAY